MNHNNIQLAALLLLVTTSLSAFAQPSPSRENIVSERTAAPPTARNFVYPQSLFVDSQNGNIWVTDFDNNRVMRFDVSSLTNVAGAPAPLRAEQYSLGQNYPNPFNPGTTITFAVQKTGHAAVTVYDLLGREVATLFSGVANAHTLYVLSFDARNLGSGIYFYTLRSENRNEVKKMGLMK